MRISFEPGTTKKFRRTAWKIQQTFRTPRNDLDRFTATMVSGMDELRGGQLAIYEWVFEPKELKALLHAASLPTELRRDQVLHAESLDEAAAMLRAAFASWVDFVFIPEPKTVCIYADHDEALTFFAQTRNNLTRAVEPLRELGYKVIEEYERRF